MNRGRRRTNTKWSSAGRYVVQSIMEVASKQYAPRSTMLVTYEPRGSPICGVASTESLGISCEGAGSADRVSERPDEPDSVPSDILDHASSKLCSANRTRQDFDTNGGLLQVPVCSSSRSLCFEMLKGLCLFSSSWPRKVFGPIPDKDDPEIRAGTI